MHSGGMTPLEYIRVRILDLNQTDMAGIAGVSQGTVSRWEAGSQVPDHTAMSRIRDHIRRRRLPWNDTWFFEVPKSAVAP